MINREQAEVVKIVADSLAKLLLAVAVSVVVVLFAVVLAFNPSWPIAAVEGFFGWIARTVYKHYFPAARSLQRPPDDEHLLLQCGSSPSRGESES